ncbi:hypothetical protein FBZ89_12445 [Nitrospirillum amazonense]|uniref:Uncharacterized protein n=1 Tax=Nitrospirillum amazonense TaxID=28077 RepID=A0A560EST1_9PROT|nr:hypothetical protein [Nitrospirillum amazonense]TWB12432.1 hypothetical protein FBZ89_12445 [Nitrospirillum amazonense]
MSPQPETQDVSARGIVYAALGLAAFVALALGVVALLVPLLGHGRGAAAVTPPRPVAGAPLDEVPYQGGAQVRAAAAAKLDRYGWADRDAGRAVIPIDRAMELLARKGWPDQDEKDAEERQ